MACVRTSSRACTQISDRHSRVLEEVLAGGGGFPLCQAEPWTCGKLWLVGRSEVSWGGAEG